MYPVNRSGLSNKLTYTTSTIEKKRGEQELAIALSLLYLGRKGRRLHRNLGLCKYTPWRVGRQTLWVTFEEPRVLPGAIPLVIKTSETDEKPSCCFAYNSLTSSVVATEQSLFIHSPSSFQKGHSRHKLSYIHSVRVRKSAHFTTRSPYLVILEEFALYKGLNLREGVALNTFYALVIAASISDLTIWLYRGNEWVSEWVIIELLTYFAIVFAIWL